jgi:hypothetical protein
MLCKRYLTQGLAATAILGSLGAVALSLPHQPVQSLTPNPLEQAQHRGSGRITAQGQPVPDSLNAHRGSGRIEGDHETMPNGWLAWRGSGRLGEDPQSPHA